MSQPIILTPPTNSAVMTLAQQIAALLASDTDPSQGLVAALGLGAKSIYPNYEASTAPSGDRTICPTPFVLVTPAGRRRLDDQLREDRVVIEIHDDPDHGMLRWPGLLWRVKWLLFHQEFRPVTDGLGTNWRGGVQFDQESPPELPDERYDTNLIQLFVFAKCQDRTSGRGHAG